MAPSTPHYSIGIPATPHHHFVPTTPSRGSVWDPQTPNTPMRPSHSTGSSWSSYLTPDSAVPTTPGNIDTPGGFATPGSNFESSKNKDFSPATWTPYPPQQNTPSTPGGPSTPSTESLLTPYSVSTPYSSSMTTNISSSNHLSVDWFMIHDVVVRTRTDSAEGVLRDYSHSDGMCRVEFNRKIIEISPENLEPVPPSEKKEQIIILGGDFKGTTGSLVAIDKDEKGNKLEAAVKLHTTFDIKFLDPQIIGKYSPK